MDILILRLLAELRSPAATFFASVFTFFGEERFLIPFAASFYWCADKKGGERLLFSLFSAATLNAYLKKSVSRPRPFAAGVAEKVEPNNFFASTADLKKNVSFPSGHAQIAAAVYGDVAFGKRGVLRKIALFVLLFFIGVSRIYLGVHYPTDVLAGAALGLGTAWLWKRIYDRRYNDRYFFALLFCLFSLLGVFFVRGRHYLFSFGALTGITAGGVAEQALLRTQPPRNNLKKIFRLIAGFAGMGGVYFLFMLFPGEPYEWLSGFAAAFWTAFVAPAFFKIFKI